MLGLLTLAVNIGCVSTKDRDRRALTAEFNKGLGQYKDHRIIEAGPPDNCVVKQTGRGEVCEWKTTDHSVRYYYDAGARTVTRRELPITPPNALPGSPPPLAIFAARPVLNLVASQISVFSVTSVSAVPPLWQINVTAGDMLDESGYGVELESKVSPRN